MTAGIVADAHPLERLGLMSVLSRLLGARRVLAVNDYAALARTVGPETRLVVIDDKLPGLEGFCGLLDFQRANPALKLVLMANVIRMETVAEALRHGLHGVMLKSMDPIHLGGALRSVLSGMVYVPREIHELALASDVPAEAADPVLHPHEADPSTLSLRQRQVLELACSGYSNKEIGRQLSISDATVKVHVGAAFRVLGIRRRAEAIAIFARGKHPVGSGAFEAVGAPPSRGE